LNESKRAPIYLAVNLVLFTHTPPLMYIFNHSDSETIPR